MTNTILVDVSFNWIRTALLEEALLVDFYEERPEKGRIKGNVYKGVVRKIDTKIQAAFIRFGATRDGFLPLKDVNQGTKELKVGDALLVQVAKDEVGDKGAALTTRLSLSGRSLVFLPNAVSDGGVSSRLPDGDRKALRIVLGKLRIPKGAAVILRTAALSKSEEDLQADLNRLTLIHQEIRDSFERRPDAGLLFREAPPVTRYLREYWQSKMDKVVVNSEEAWAEARDFFIQHEPDDLKKLELSPLGSRLFQEYGVEAQISKLDDRKVTLPSGANIVIERTEALVSIDVNSAKSKSEADDLEPEENLYRINREAAYEIARQIRLRDLGGIILVDFIDMREASHRQELDAYMKSLCTHDKAKLKVYGLSPMGLMEINRQRLRKMPEMREAIACTHCSGTGQKENAEALVLQGLRSIESKLASRKSGGEITITLPMEAANLLWNEFRETLQEIEQRWQTTIKIQAAEGQVTDALVSIVTHPKSSTLRHSRTVNRPSQVTLPAHRKIPPIPEAEKSVGTLMPSSVPKEVEGADDPSNPRDPQAANQAPKSNRRRRRGRGKSKGGQTLGMDTSAGALTSPPPILNAQILPELKRRRRSRRGGRRRANKA